MDRIKTIFCDIDGTLIKHNNNINKQHTDKGELLDETLTKLKDWDKKCYNIILVTGRRESTRKNTETQLSELGIIYDQLIMGIGGGPRILINDKKNNDPHNMAYSINLPRNKGIQNINLETEYINTNKNYELNKTDKPWGYEELLEYNDNYVLKKLAMNKGYCCSLQYHELKKETIYVLSGLLKLYIGNTIDNLNTRILKPNDYVTIDPYTIHRTEAIEDSIFLESSTNQLYDVIRLEDKYGRVG